MVRVTKLKDPGASAVLYKRVKCDVMAPRVEPEELAPAPDSPCDCAPCGKRTCGYCWKRRFVCMSCGAVHKRMRLAAL